MPGASPTIFLVTCHAEYDLAGKRCGCLAHLILLTRGRGCCLSKRRNGGRRRYCNILLRRCAKNPVTRTKQPQTNRVLQRPSPSAPPASIPKGNRLLSPPTRASHCPPKQTAHIVLRMEYSSRINSAAGPDEVSHACRTSLHGAANPQQYVLLHRPALPRAMSTSHTPPGSIAVPFSVCNH